MKKIVLLFVVLTTLTYSQVTRKVLFLGNSYTYVNNLPQLIADIADAQGDSLIYDANTIGGYTFDNHAADPVSVAKLTAGGWDYVILQEQSQLPSWQSYFSQGLWNLVDYTRKFSPCGRPLFYMTWGRQNGDATNCAAWPPVCTYIGMDTLLRRRYIEMATNYLGEVSPVGAAWRYVRQNFPSINLYNPDQSHPSFSGSYLAACCFYAAIFKKNPAQITSNFTLPAAEANILKQAAKVVMFDSIPFWDFSVLTPTASFGHLPGIGNNQVNFNNTSLQANTYLWNFGDGSTSTLKNPTHSYTANGIYTITLTAFNCDLDSTYQSTFQSTVSFCAHTPSISPASITLCPNATDTLWTQSYNSYQWYEVVSGTFSATAVPGATNQYFVPVPAREYYVVAGQNGCYERSAIVEVQIVVNMANFVVMPYGNFLAPDTACIGENVLLVLAPVKPPFFNYDTWIDWTLNGQPIPGFHNDSLVISSTGVYGVTLRHDLCPGLVRYDNQLLNYVFVPCIAGLSAQLSQADIKMYPNPSADKVVVDIPATWQGCSYRINDATGRNITQGTLVNQKNDIGINSLARGVYILILEQDGIVQHLRLIKN